jgi:3',5'-nucleoside bisphosphate phosphatase
MPDIPGYTTLKGDFHTHTVFSDGNVWPTVRVQEAWRDGLDALAITDHVEYLPHKDFIPVNHNAAWEICRTLAEEKNIILVHGAELNRDMPPGHLNALFIQDAAALAVPDIMDAVEAAVRQGAFIMYNHPGWEAQEKDGIPKLYPIHRDLIAKGRLHGIEYVNTYSRYPLVLDMCRDHRLAVMGDSDAHDVISEIYKASENAHRPVTLVFAKERSSASIREAMFAGRTAVWSGNELAGFENVAAPFFRAAVSVAKPHRTDDKSIWFEVGNVSDLPFFLTGGPVGAPSSLTIPANGSVIVKAERRYLTEPLAYTVKNVVIGNGKSLAVTLAPGAGPADLRIR